MGTSFDFEMSAYKNQVVIGSIYKSSYKQIASVYLPNGC